MQHTVIVHFFAVDLNFKPNSYTFYGGNFVSAHEKCYCLSSCSLLLIFILLFPSISRFLAGATKFSCYYSKELPLLCFSSLALAISLLSASVKAQKFSRKKKKKKTRLCCVFSVQKSGWPCDLLPIRAGLECEISPIRLAGMGGRTDRRTDGHVNTNSSCIDRFPFSIVGKLLLRPICARESSPLIGN